MKDKKKYNAYMRAYKKQERLLRPEEVRARQRQAHADWRERCKFDRAKWAASLIHTIKNRAKKAGLDFNLKLADLVVPDECPVLRVPILMGEKWSHPQSPSVDRVKPELGYVRGNVRIISWRANRLKCDATVGELKALLIYMEGR